MTTKIHDDATGEVIESGRSFRVGIYMGDDNPKEPRDYANIDDLLDVIRDALTGTRSRPPLQIIVHSWEHFLPDDRRAEWQK